MTDRKVLSECARVRSGPGLMEAGRYRMVSEPTLTLTVSRARVSQLRKHGVHGWCGP